MSVITNLEQQVRERNLNPKAACLKQLDEGEAPSTSSGNTGDQDTPSTLSNVNPLEEQEQSTVFTFSQQNAEQQIATATTASDKLPATRSSSVSSSDKIPRKQDGLKKRSQNGGRLSPTLKQQKNIKMEDIDIALQSSPSLTTQ